MSQLNIGVAQATPTLMEIHQDELNEQRVALTAIVKHQEQEFVRAHLMLEIGDVITTQRNGLTGIIKEIVPNKTGTYRVRYQHPTAGMLRTTYDPRRGEGN